MVRRTLVLVLLATGLGAPLAFGATEVWAYCTLQVLGAVAAAVSIWDGHAPRHWWLPLCVVVAGWTQTVRLPEFLAEQFAPMSAQARAEAGPLMGTVDTSSPVSLDVAVTLAATRRCVLWTLLCILTAHGARDPVFRRQLLAGVALSGLISLSLGLCLGSARDQEALGFHDMRGIWKAYKNPLLTGFHSQGTGYADQVTVRGISYVASSPIVGIPAGSFVNANHFAACIGLTCPIVIGVLLCLTVRCTRYRAGIYGLAVLLGALSLFAIAGIAKSRGACAAMCLAGGGVLLVRSAATRPRLAATVFSLGLTLAAVLVFAVLNNDSPAWLERLLQGSAARLDSTRAAVEMLQQSPWLGIGLGCYGKAYPALRPGDGIFYLAHNVWAEVAAETGAVGLFLLALIAALLLNRLWRGRQSDASYERQILRGALWTSLTFAALHGIVDHGVQIPANACLCAVVAGLLLSDVPVESVPARFGAMQSLLLRWLPRAALACVAIWLTWGAWIEFDVERQVWPLRVAIARQRLPNRDLSPEDKREELRLAVPAAETASGRDPQQAVVAADLGNAWLHLSDGQPGEELEQADYWYVRSLRLSPINPWIRQTLQAIQERLTIPENRLRNAPSSLDRPDGPLSPAGN